MKTLSLRRLSITLLLMLLVTVSSVHAQSGGCSVSSGSLGGVPFAGNIYAPLDNALLTEAAELSMRFGVNPAVFYMRESEGPNAVATPERFPNLLAQEGRPFFFGDGSVLVGVDLLRTEFATTRGSGLSIPGIMAHEFAHIAQNKYGFQWQGKWRELHADFMAGWYVSHRGHYRVPNDAYQAAMSLFNKGDYDFNSSGHHGTPFERLAAFQAGYQFNQRTNNPNGILAYNAGIVYLRG